MTSRTPKRNSLCSLRLCGEYIRKVGTLRLVGILAFSLLVALLLSGGVSRAQTPFADKSFQQIWEHTDAPVLSGVVKRSWYWGPAPGTAMNEPYSGSKTGTRQVQYFDKARMEINNPAGDRNSEWFVTTGLLVVDLVSGKQQVGDKEFVPRQAAEIAVGGDGLESDPDAPTYTSFRPVSSIMVPGANRAPKLTGQSVTATINRAGQIGSNAALGLYAGAKLAAYVDVTGHNIPQAMWDFLNLKGPVQQDGAIVQVQTIANWVFVMGYPITEPYWARVKVDGVYRDILFQLFERRSLAYLPSYVEGWQVQMGNVGQHYQRWLYGGPLPTPLVPLPSPVVPPLPPPIDATISPVSAQVGVTLSASIRGFTPGEGIVSWFTRPDLTTSDARINLTARVDGTVDNILVPTAGLSPGSWAITFHGRVSGHESIAYFYLTAAPPVSVTNTPSTLPTGTATVPRTSTAGPTSTRTPTPPRGSASPTATFPPVPTQPPTGLLLSARPGYGPPDVQFTFSASGLSPNEPVQVKFTDPNGSVVYPAGSNNGRYAAGPDGRLEITLVPSQVFPSAPLGNWLFELRGEESNQEGVVGFTLR